MSETGDYASLEELVLRINPEYQLVRAWPLAGGVSAQVTALEIVQPDEQMRRMVVRRHGAADLAANPNIAADEFRLLKRLREADLPAPEPIYVDADGEILGAPCLVAAYIEGTPEFAPPDVNAFVGEMAALLARIHGISGEEVAFLPDMQAIAAAKLRTRPDEPDETLGELQILYILEKQRFPHPANPSVLLHGDFWPGNLLWQAGRLVGVIDWEDAALGDPLADVANTRLELLWALGGATPGVALMEEFTRQYRALQPGVEWAHLPSWDLYAALKPMHKLALWAKDAESEAKMCAGHRLFVAQALETIASAGTR